MSEEFTTEFTPFYEYITAKKELDLHEKLIVCRVLRWKEAGCFESNNTLSKALSMHRRTIQRVIKRLVRLGWVGCLYDPTPRDRTMWINPEKLIDGPLFVNCGYNYVPSIIAEREINYESKYGVKYSVF